MELREEIYDAWCQKIADSKSADELIAHFREHVNNHFDRHNRGGALSQKVWMIGVLNFMHIFKKKFPGIAVEDMLFKLCTFHKHHGGIVPDFNIDLFMEDYDGDIKELHKW
ncbi:MAG: hypothetical protein WC461_00745 [Candidatus Paceibacterota bacterium]